jgi:Porin subfamily
MPGTDLCIKVGGWVRAEEAWGSNGNMTWGPFNGNVNNRLTSNEALRARGYITADVRNQTEYGTVRGYIAVGLNTNDVGLQVANLVDSANRAFVQWAGMTAGLSQSFFDFYSVPAVQYRGGYLPASDTGDGGWWVWAYTAQFGGGFSGTISSEARRTTQIIDANGLPGPAGTAALAGAGTIIPGGYPCAVTASAPAPIVAGTAAGGCGSEFPGTGAYGGFQSPDIVANLRVDQAWGGAQVMGALHEVNASYYSAANALQTAPSTTGAGGVGHPGDKWGWAAGVGLKINAPFITQGDWFQAQANVTQGALRYLFNTPNSNWGKVDQGKEAYGVLSDCVYAGVVAIGNNTGCMLTSAWGINASFEHYWTPAWHTSLYGAYYAVSYGQGTGSANANLCSAAGFGNTLAGTLAVAGAGCNNNWQTWGIGARTQWDVTKTFYLGVEVLYQDLHSATTGTGSVIGPAGFASYAFGGATVNEANSTNWMVSIRAHRDFLP